MRSDSSEWISVVPLLHHSPSRRQVDFQNFEDRQPIDSSMYTMLQNYYQRLLGPIDFNFSKLGKYHCCKIKKYVKQVEDILDTSCIPYIYIVSTPTHPKLNNSLKSRTIWLWVTVSRPGFIISGTKFKHTITAIEKKIYLLVGLRLKNYCEIIKFF